jgi:hypothetical protein
MCYSFRTSILSYVLGIISGIFALFTRQIVLGLLILTYSQIQFSEMLIWYGIDNNNIKINKFGTSYGKYLLATHNIAISVGIIISVLLISKKSFDISYFVPLIISILFFMFIVIFYYLPTNYPDITLPLDKNCTNTTNRCQNPNNRLNWEWPYSWYIYGFIISLILLWIYIKPLNSKLWLFFIFISTLVYMLIFNKTVVGSLWCFSAAILAPLIVIVNYFIIRNMNSVDILI